MVTLNPAQAGALDELAEVDRKYRSARLMAKKRAEALVAAELAAIEEERDQAAWRAYSLRVPKQRIGRDGLHTSDPESLNRILRRFSPDPVRIPVSPNLARSAGRSVPAAPPEIQRTPAAPSVEAPFEWDDIGRERVRVNLRHFPTLSKREGFPEVLTGVVERDEFARSGWSVLDDPTDEAQQYGSLPGFLRDEVDRQFYPEQEENWPASHLPSVLTAWAEANR